MKITQLSPPPTVVKIAEDQKNNFSWTSWFASVYESLRFLLGERSVEILVPLAFSKAGGVNDPIWVKAADNGAGSTGIYVWAFPHNSEKELFFTVHLGHHYVEGSDIELDFHWAAFDATAGNVVWGIEYAWVNTNEPIGNTTILEATVAASGVTHHLEEKLFTLDGAGRTRQSVIQGRFFRKAADPADTYGNSAMASNIDVHTRILIDNDD